MTIPAGVLSRLRRVSDDHLPDTCTIQRKGLSGLTKTWSTLATVACRVRIAPSLRPPEQYHLGEPAADIDAEITVRVGTDVTPADRIEALGVTYEIVRVTPERSYEARRRILVRRER